MSLRMRKIVYISCVSIISVLIVVWVCFCIRLTNQTTSLLNTRVAYETEIEQLKCLKGELEFEINQLNISKEELLLRKESLDFEINALNDSVTLLKEEQTLLESNIVELNSELEQIAAKIDEEKSIETFDFVFLDGKIGKNCVRIVTQELSLLPSKVISLYENHNAKLYITTKNIGKEIFNGKYKSVQGVTLYGQNEIYIEDREIACRNATLHECGHLFNEYMGYAAHTDEFRTIYLEEFDSFESLAGSYCASNMDECFAEAFLLYFKNKASLDKHCPKMSQYMEKLVM